VERSLQMINYLIVAEFSFVFMLIFVLLFMKRNHKGNVYLAVYLFNCSALFSTIFFITNKFPVISYISSCLSMGFIPLSGFLIYLYVKTISGEKIVHERLHFIAPSVLMILSFIVFEIHPTSKELLPMIMFFSSLVLPILYIFKIFSILRGYSARAENWYSNFNSISMGWLKVIVVLSLIIFVGWCLLLSFGMYQNHSAAGFVLHSLLYLNLVIIFITAFYVIRQEEIFKDSESLNENSSDKKDEHVKYSKQKIEDKVFEKYKENLLAYMKKHKPYLDEDITIRTLAEQVAIPIHHLSIVINSRLNKNFSSFINEYRVNEALRLLRESGDDKINILSVAFQSGFNSKASFNSVFKKMTGKAPSDFRSINA
jgi:AraC-like DNA-binding protein